jgi:hypothetical protein
MTRETDRNGPAVTHSEKHLHGVEPPLARPSQKEHEGATEDEVKPIMLPTGPEYDNEPKQG